MKLDIDGAKFSLNKSDVATIKGTSTARSSVKIALNDTYEPLRAKNEYSTSSKAMNYKPLDIDFFRLDGYTLTKRVR